MFPNKGPIPQKNVGYATKSVHGNRNELSWTRHAGSLHRERGISPCRDGVVPPARGISTPTYPGRARAARYGRFVPRGTEARAARYGRLVPRGTGSSCREVRKARAARYWKLVPRGTEARAARYGSSCREVLEARAARYGSSCREVRKLVPRGTEARAARYGSSCREVRKLVPRGTAG
jgi:hypothetical protein